MSRLGFVLGMAAAIAVAVAFCWGVWVADENAAQKAEQWRNDPRNPINVCIAKGGVPITSAWDGRLKECQIVGGAQ